ncbi:exo-alpha-sialidase [Shewanella sp. NIFS-20-20]|uniref:exo-alpha-sialidase n=1 Tax=Shewanella sp. NIFS-20-20 TaxID=2853806 RepID=UPI001C48372B|nr:exo-alpha-sialidase [Shewanella sp. NIFS-20-20]MBV7315049.1 exo-alpha-sialidase [Shewanella sp. NIFS-20-20]
MQLVDVNMIWDQAPHSAFTDLCFFEGRFYCVFRVGDAHISDSADLQILVSDEGQHWQPMARITEANKDLRDGKWFIFKQQLYLTAAAIDRRESAVPATRLQTLGWRLDAKGWHGPNPLVADHYWLWKCTANQDDNLVVGAGYRGGPQGEARLYTSDNGQTFDCVLAPLNNQGYVNEAAPLFIDDELYLLLRRDPVGDDRETALLGRAQAPYEDWHWRTLSCRIGGPALFYWRQQLYGVVRLYDNNVRTAVVAIDTETGQVSEQLTLPSAGDTSYAGVVLQDDRLFVSYYSSHQSHTAIYFAVVGLA